MSAPQKKSCKQCGKTKPLRDYYKVPQNRDGRSGKCKTCTKAYVQAWNARNKKRNYEQRRRWAQNNRERVRINSRKSYRRHLKKNRERSRAYHAKPEVRERTRWSHIKRAYGVTREQWLALFESQGRRCGCCGHDQPRGRNWHTEHDHKTGALRGVVCTTCNTMLGAAHDDPRVLAAGIKYLRRAAC